MKEHLWFEEKVPFYVNGQLPQNEREEMESHLQACAACRNEFLFWQSVAGVVVDENQQISAPRDLTERIVLQPRRSFSLKKIVMYIWQLLKYQVPLVRQDMWPASAVMMFIGVTVAVITVKISVIYFLAPMIAAATLALIYGPENDPAFELANATSTSPAMVLFARLTLVSAFNLVLGLAASFIAVFFLPQVSFWMLLFTWLAPMAFLSMLSLFLSMLLGAGNAVAITYAIWVFQFIPLKQWHLFEMLPAWMQKVTILQSFWQNNQLLLIGTLCLLVLCLVFSRFSSLSLSRQTA